MTKARDVMHMGAECINEDESLLTAAQMMRDLNVGSLPICGRCTWARGRTNIKTLPNSSAGLISPTTSSACS